ncbi:MAG: signal peptidase I [Bacilli bacterium]|jgi:signal peptidase|nr:signal peptidase I [Bacilli bacterium]MCH4278322.1 signal peptidase I [Bacilli bacterium]
MSLQAILYLVFSIILLALVAGLLTWAIHHQYSALSNGVEKGDEDASLLKENEKGPKKSKKTFNLIANILGDCLLLVLIGFFSFSLYSKISGNEPMIFGNESIVVASGSMSEKNKANSYLVENDLNNQFDTYDLIGISEYASQDEVALYDVVAYKSDSGITVIHRIIEIHDESGSRTYLTRGDSNNASDNFDDTFYNGYLSYDRIIGRYNGFRWRGIGHLIYFFQSGYGIETVVAIIYLSLMFAKERNMYLKSRQKRLEFLLKNNEDSDSTGGK